jgi:hypothetical protein
MKLRKDWIRNIIFLWIILISVYRLFGDVNSVAWSVFWFCTEFVFVLAILIRLLQKETETNVKFYYWIAIVFYGFSTIYEILKLSSKNYAEYMNRCTDQYYSLMGVVLIFVILTYSLFERYD